MFIGFYPLPIGLFLIIFSGFLLTYILSGKLQTILDKYKWIIFTLAWINGCLLFYLLHSTSWDIYTAGNFYGARDLLNTGQYLSFFERYLEYVAMYLSYYFIAKTITLIIVKDFFPKGGKLAKSFLLFITLGIINSIFVLPLLVPTFLMIRLQFLFWTYALVGFQSLSLMSDSIIGLIVLLVFLTFPENLIFFQLLNKIRKGNL